MRLGIIGTAGRKEDGPRLAKEPGHWRAMRAVAQIVTTVLAPDELISGGAAVADHLAVMLYLEDAVPHLTLHLPAEWDGKGFVKTSSSFHDPASVANHYHELFSDWAKIDSFAQIQQAIEKGACVHTGAGGFHARNSDVANQSDALLAFTFGQGAQLKDSGTKDTWDKFVHKLVGGVGRHPQSAAYHYCLNTKRLYSV